MSTVAEIQEYLETCAKALGMDEWRVRYDFKGRTDEDEVACVRPVDGTYAHIAFGPDFWEETAEEQAESIAHELFHCRVRWWSEICDAILQTMRERDRRGWKPLLDLAEENACRGVERQLAKLLPQKKLTQPDIASDDADEED